MYSKEAANAHDLQSLNEVTVKHVAQSVMNDEKEFSPYHFSSSTLDICNVKMYYHRGKEWRKRASGRLISNSYTHKNHTAYPQPLICDQ